MARKITGIRKKGNGYESRFTVNGSRFSVYGRTPDECKEKEAELRQKLAEGRYKPGKELTISEYFERWIEAKQDTVKETTIRTNKILFKAMAETAIDTTGQTFGSLKLPAIETQNIRDLQTALRKERIITIKGKKVTRKACTTRTVNDSISLLKSILQSAVNERILTWNAAAGIKSLKRTEPAARDTTHRALTREETAAFLQQAAESKSWYRYLYTFLLHTGCRIGEAGAFNLSDILNGKSSKGLSINRTITRTESGGYIVGSDTKTAAGKRYIPLDQEAQQAIEQQRIQNAAFNGENVVSIKQPVFLSPYGSLLKASSVNLDIKAICKKAGIERFTVHAFRDTFATRCVESGMQQKVLQDIMGHSDINMTMNLYAHSMDQSKEEQLKVVNFN